VQVHGEVDNDHLLDNRHIHVGGYLVVEEVR
jgi:hypothetical protein